MDVAISAFNLSNTSLLLSWEDLLLQPNQSVNNQKNQFL